MRQRLAKIAVAVEAVSAAAVITGAVALATNSVAGNSGDGFNSKASVGMLPRRLCFWITNSPQQLSALRTAVHQWLTSSIYSHRCYHRRATIFSFHPFL